MNMNDCNFGGDKTLTKVFVGGLAWETRKEALREHFGKYGEIIEAVVIYDKVTGKSKGYGFVTFKEPEAANKACEDAAPFINGRKANCSIATHGARRPTKASTPTPPLLKRGFRSGAENMSAAAKSHVQWQYPPAQRSHFQAVPVYGYSPAYIAPPYPNYTPRFAYINGYYPEPMMGANTMMPMYPFYHQAMGFPAHIYPTANVGPVASVPAHDASMDMVAAEDNMKKSA